MFLRVCTPSIIVALFCSLTFERLTLLSFQASFLVLKEILSQRYQLELRITAPFRLEYSI